MTPALNRSFMYLETGLHLDLHHHFPPIMQPGGVHLQQDARVEILCGRLRNKLSVPQLGAVGRCTAITKQAGAALCKGRQVRGRACPMEAAASGSSSKSATLDRQSAPSSPTIVFSSCRRGIVSAPKQIFVCSHTRSLNHPGTCKCHHLKLQKGRAVGPAGIMPSAWD